MKRLALTAAAALALAAITSYYGTPLSFKEALLALNRSLSGLEEKTVDIAMHKIHYLESDSHTPSAEPGGNATPIVLLHGSFAEKDHWVDFARSLTGRYHVVIPDLPGFGESSRHDDQPYDYAAQVARLGNFLGRLGIQRAHLAGSSMGGTIAALYAIEHPARTASVAFIGAPHGIRSPRGSTMDQLIDAGQRPLVAHDAETFDAMMALVFERPPFLPYPILAATKRQALRDAAANERLWDAQLKDRYLLQQQLGRLQRPTLALWGASDRVFDVSGAQILRSMLPESRVDTLPGMGHLPMMEAPDDTARRYANFLSAVEASQGTTAKKEK